MNSIEKYVSIFFFLLFFTFCASNHPRSSAKGTEVEYSYPNCGCASNNAHVVYTQDPQKIFYEDGVVRYSQRNLLILDPRLREEYIELDPNAVVLHNYYTKEDIPVIIPKARAVATFDESHLLQPKTFLEEFGVKVYKRRGSGLKGLEAIKAFQKQNKGVETYEDTDKFVGDRVDNVGRIKSN
jgi:hypothetical protein